MRATESPPPLISLHTGVLRTPPPTPPTPPHQTHHLPGKVPPYLRFASQSPSCIQNSPRGLPHRIAAAVISELRDAKKVMERGAIDGA